MSTVAFFALWDQEWQLAERVDFDGVNKRIFVHPEVNELVVRRDLYSAWKRWVELQENAKYEQAFRVVGGDPLSGGLRAGDIYFLLNGWKLVVDHEIRIDGILYAEVNESAGAELARGSAFEDSPYEILPGGGVVATVSSLTQTIETVVPVVTGDTSQIPADVWAQLASLQTQPGSMGALLKDMEANVNQSNNLTVNMSTKVTSMDTKVSALDGKIDGVVTSVDASTTAVNAMTGRFDSVDAQITAIDGKVVDVDGKLVQISTKVDAVDGRFDNVDTALTDVGTKVDAATTAVGEFDGRFDTVDTKLTDVTTKVDGVATRFDSVDTELAAVKDATTALQTTVTEQADGYEALQTDVTTVLANLGVVTDLINTVLKYNKNKTKIDQANATMTVFDDDGVTPLKIFDLKNIAGQPSVTQVAERRPR